MSFVALAVDETILCKKSFFVFLYFFIFVKRQEERTEFFM